MKPLVFSVGIFLYMAPYAMAQSNNAALWEGRAFSEARQDLLRQGWKPFESDERTKSGCRVNHISAARRLYKSGFREIEVCSEGRVYCVFNYTHGRQCLRVVTEGEQVPKVYSWKQDCSEFPPGLSGSSNPKPSQENCSWEYQ